MNCQEFWNTMPELSSGANTQRAEHPDGCPACTARLNHQRALQTGLQAVARELSRLEAPARVEVRLKAAFRCQAGLAMNPPFSRRWTPIMTWAPAAAAVIGLALFLVRDRQPQPPRQSTQRIELASAELPADVETYGDAASPDNDFIALPNAPRIGPDEDVNLVRVELPRSAMMALGLGVRPGRALESVEADVMLGSDGLARAVRFLE